MRLTVSNRVHHGDGAWSDIELDECAGVFGYDVVEYGVSEYYWNAFLVGEGEEDEA
jgi:hypothetical protein